MTQQHIIIQRDNVILDGAGNTLQVPDPPVLSGVSLINRTGVTVKNLNIIGFHSGIHIENSSHITVINNNLFSGSYEVRILFSSNLSFTSNYWNDYSGTDSNGDGIGDTPYIIDENNQDNYPSMNPVNVSKIPEFPSWIFLPLFLIVTGSVIMLKKKSLNNRS